MVVPTVLVRLSILVVSALSALVRVLISVCTIAALLLVVEVSWSNVVVVAASAAARTVASFIIAARPCALTASSPYTCWLTDSVAVTLAVNSLRT